MRWLTGTQPDDRGVASIFVIIAMTAVLGGAALAIDVGGYVVAARSAQNSADATVLAVATDCAMTGAPSTDYSPYRKAGQTITAPACGSGEATITVTKEVDGLLLAQSAGSVNRRATAKWGILSGGSTLPIVLADCEFTGVRNQTEVTLYLDDTKPQSGCSSLPGGFSQLQGTGCAVPFASGNTVIGSPGADLQKVVPCITNPDGPPLPYDVLVPVYDSALCQATGCKGKGPYLIVGFAVLEVKGYSFNGKSYDGSLDKKCPDDKTRGKYCIQGFFTTITKFNGTTGSGTDFGAYKVYLSS